MNNSDGREGDSGGIRLIDLLDPWHEPSKPPLDECLRVIEAGLTQFPKDNELDNLRVEALGLKRYGRGTIEGKGLEMMMRAGRFV